MLFDFWGFGAGWHLSQPAGFVSYILLIFYSLFAVGVLAATRNDWLKMRAGQWLTVLVLAAAGILAAEALIIRFPADILPPPGVPVEPQRPGLALLALVPAFLAGGWLGIGPALVIGFLTGLMRAGFETYVAFTAFEYAFLAAMVAGAVRQNYTGWLMAMARRPVVAGLIFGLGLALFLFLSYFAYSETAGLAAIDYVVSMAYAAAPIFVGQAVIAGLVAEVARLAMPRWWPHEPARQPAPYVRSLNRKLLFTLIPLFMVGIATLFWADLRIANDVSTTLALDQMARAAENAGREIPFFVQTGASMLREIALSRSWLRLDTLDQTAGLLQSMRQLAFFKQLTLLDLNGQRIAAAGQTADPSALPALTDADLILIQSALSGQPANDVRVVSGENGLPLAQVVFVAPVIDPDTGQVVGVLVGETDLANNPLMQSAAATLSNIAGGVGQGMIVDERGQVIFHPDQTVIGTLYAPTEPAGGLLDSPLPDGVAYRDRAPDGTREMVLEYTAPGHPWKIVLSVPNVVVLRLASQIAVPIVFILAVTGLLGLLFVSLIALQITRPAEELAHAAQIISEGQLDQPVRVHGDDEIGRAGQAFEHMRQKLDARLKELSLLLRVSQSVSSNLNLGEALPPILQGALKATSASGVRIVLIAAESAGGRLPAGANGTVNLQTFAAGPASELMAALDRQLLELVKPGERLIVDNLARPRTVLDAAAVGGRIGSLVALPLFQDPTNYGLIWLAYDRPHAFSDAELNFLQTLAGQAMIAVANGRLFETAEQGRRQLAATLASTPDPVIVTDRGNRVVLVNPAAEQAFRFSAQSVVDRPLAEVLPNRELVRLINDGVTKEGASGEFPGVAGRVLYASVSPIISADGTAIGRVCVLRDVTHFKELDEMKSEFVANVSHDLRAPLTYMRGYATMIPMVGPLNDKQREFSDKIIGGIESMTHLIDTLLDLGRIEAGVGVEKEPCRLQDLARDVVETHQSAAALKGLHLQLEASDHLPPLYGDATLLRMAINNYVENAIKYTPQGGDIAVRLELVDERFRVAVNDTGVGIAPADQQHLFEKFFRVKQRGATSVKGSGLGLAMVRSIIERHGGKVYSESRLGKGSTFGFELPFERVPATPVPSRR
ncbi:MAG: HAMP domain-containing protein [Anaerolineales bacterium]|nr:HAMP domain-containing protein [Anaerolineales bacterium]